MDLIPRYKGDDSDIVTLFVVGIYLLIVLLILIKKQKFKALIGKSKHSVEYNIKNGFLNLPKGCYIHLEKQAKEYILRNIKGDKLTKGSIISKLKYFEGDSGKKPTFSNFLDY